MPCVKKDILHFGLSVQCQIYKNKVSSRYEAVDGRLG